MSDEAAYRPDVIPAVCESGHVTYPTAYVLEGGEATLRGESKVRPCPVCGGRRVVPPGEYKSEGGVVRRTGGPVDGNYVISAPETPGGDQVHGEAAGDERLDELDELRALLLPGPPAYVITDCRIDRAVGPYEKCGHGGLRLHVGPGGSITTGLLVARGGAVIRGLPEGGFVISACPQCG